MENNTTKFNETSSIKHVALILLFAIYSYSKRHNKFLFPALAGAIYGSSCKAENEISNVVNYKFIEWNLENGTSKE